MTAAIIDGFREWRDLPPTERLRRCPDFVSKIVQRAVEDLDVERVWLFGSRARGDERPISDYDLAFCVPAARRDRWPLFCVEVEEEARTLQAIDLVRLDGAGGELEEQIKAEGVLIYEKNRLIEKDRAGVEKP